MILANNFEKILVVFNKHYVDYLIVGGYAVVFYGYGRATGDLDIWVKPVGGNKISIINSFKELRFPPNIIDAINKIKDFTQPFAIKIGEVPIQLDIFNAITGVDYDSASGKAIPFRFSENFECRFIHLHDLIINKMLTGRLKDAADVDELQKINLHSKDKSIVKMIKNMFKK